MFVIIDLSSMWLHVILVTRFWKYYGSSQIYTFSLVRKKRTVYMVIFQKKMCTMTRIGVVMTHEMVCLKKPHRNF